MTIEEEKRKFEEAIIDMAVAEHHKYCMYYKRPKSEKDARMFYTAFKLGITKGMEYATNQIIQHNKKLEEDKNERTNGIKETNLADKGEKND